MYEVFSNQAQLFGLVAGGISLASYVPYIRDIVAGRTKPQRSSWLIWAVVAVIAFAAQVAEGATQSLWFTGSQTLATLIVFALSFAYGVGSYVNRLDFVTLCIASAATLVWYLTDVPAVALFCAIGINALAGALTIKKAFFAPQTETLVMWVINGLASVLGVLSVGQMDLILLAYPAYLLSLYVAVSLAILMGRAMEARRVALRPAPYAPVFGNTRAGS